MKYKSLTCHYCNKIGDIQRQCFLWKKESKGNQERKENNSDRVFTTTPDDLLIVGQESTITIVSDESYWIIDSGASIHVTPRKEFFTSYTSGDFGVLKMGNDGVAKVIGVGDVCLETNVKVKLLLKDVKHALDVRLNLISGKKLDDEGCINYFGDGKWKLGNLVMARGNKTSSLYVMQSTISKGSMNIVENKEASDLWHRRLGHISEKGLNYLAKKGTFRLEEYRVGEMFSLHR